MNIDKVHLLHCILSIFSVIRESLFYVRTLFLDIKIGQEILSSTTGSRDLLRLMTKNNRRFLKMTLENQQETLLLRVS